MPKLPNLCLCVVVTLAGCQSMGSWGLGLGCPIPQAGQSATESDDQTFCANPLDACRGFNPLGLRLRPFGNRYSNGLDDFFSRRAATLSANQALRELRRVAGQRFSAEFEDGFRQAHIDMATGGSGEIPVVPPRRYWNRTYRTAAGHGQVQEWFEGYRIAANEVHAVGTYETNTVAAATFLDAENHEYYARDAADRPTDLVSAPQPRIAAPEAGFEQPAHDTKELLLEPSINVNSVPPVPADAESLDDTPAQSPALDQSPAPDHSLSINNGHSTPEPTVNETEGSDGWDFQALREKVKLSSFELVLPSIRPTLPAMPSIKHAIPSVKMPTLPNKLPSVNVNVPPMPAAVKRMGAAIRGH